jgi:diacylglycerol O-acyltransferase
VDQLTTIDAGFLHAEDSDRHVSLAIGGLAVVEGPAPDYDSLITILAQRISHCPRFAQRLRMRPFNLGAPVWVDDPEFDLSHHVRRIAVPQPGSDRELFQLIAEMMSWRLDRSRPLWEIWAIEGLAGGQWAMLMKVHRCIADPIATAHMLAGLSDGGVGNSLAGDIRAARDPEPSRLAIPNLSLNPMRWASDLWKTSATMATATARAARGAAELTASLVRPTPASSLNGSITDLRRYSAARISLDDIKLVCRTFGVTINDVALAALTESYRDLLTRHGEPPLPDSLRTLVPVSARPTDTFDATDNRVSVMLPYLPVDEDSPVRRLRKVHSRLSKAKATGQRQAGSAFVSIANAVPFALTAWTMRLLTRLPQRGVVALATNVPGPAEPLKIMGRKVTAVMPVPPIAMQLRTGVAMLSYADDLFFGILADFDAIPDVDELAHGIEVAVARLVARSKRRQAVRERRGLSLVVSA